MKLKTLSLAIVLGLTTHFSLAVDEKPAPAPDAKAPAANANSTNNAAASNRSACLWSWQAVSPQAVPAVKQKAWVRTPVDAFVLARRWLDLALPRLCDQRLQSG